MKLSTSVKLACLIPCWYVGAYGSWDTMLAFVGFFVLVGLHSLVEKFEEGGN